MEYKYYLIFFQTYSSFYYLDKNFATLLENFLIKSVGAKINQLPPPIISVLLLRKTIYKQLYLKLYNQYLVKNNLRMNFHWLFLCSLLIH